MDKEYKFILNKDNDLLNQNYRIETKALFVELYEKYLAPKEDGEFWNKYDKICNNMIEEEKRIKYNSDNIFKNNKKKIILNSTKQEQKLDLIETNNIKWYKKVWKFITRFFSK